MRQIDSKKKGNEDDEEYGILKKRMEDSLKMYE
jgi:hypothetical protein